MTIKNLEIGKYYKIKWPYEFYLKTNPNCDKMGVSFWPVARTKKSTSTNLMGEIVTFIETTNRTYKWHEQVHIPITEEIHVFLWENKKVYCLSNMDLEVFEEVNELC